MDFEEMWKLAAVTYFIGGILCLALYSLTGDGESLLGGLGFLAGGVLLVYYWFYPEGSRRGLSIGSEKTLWKERGFRR